MLRGICIVLIGLGLLAPLSQTVAAEPLPAWHEVLAPALAAAAANDAATAVRVAETDAARFKARAAYAPPDPVILLAVQALPTDLDATGEAMTQVPLVAVSQTLPWWRKLDARAAVQEARAAALAAEAVELAEARALAAVAAAFTLEQLRVERAALEESLLWLSLLLESAAARYGAGSGLAADVERLRVALGRMQASALQLTAATAAAHAEWHYLTAAAPLPNLVDAPDWHPPAAWATAVSAAAPQLAVVRARAQAAAAAQREARAGYGPDLMLELGYGVRHADRRDFFHAKLGLSLPLWAPWSQAPRLEAAAAAAAAADLRVVDTDRAVRAAWARWLATHAAAAARERLYREAILPAAATARDSAVNAYRSGAADLNTALDAVGREIDVRREAARTTAERRLAEAQLLAWMGRLAVLP